MTRKFVAHWRTKTGVGLTSVFCATAALWRVGHW